MTEQERVRPPGAVHTRRAALYLLLGFGGSLMPMPFSLAAVPPLGHAVVESVRAVRETRVADAPRGARVSTAIGLGLSLALLALVLLPYAFWGTTRDLQDCLAGANTQTARSACEQESGDRPVLMRLVLGR